MKQRRDFILRDEYALFSYLVASGLSDIVPAELVVSHRD
jgi:hypothetical protein